MGLSTGARSTTEMLIHDIKDKKSFIALLRLIEGGVLIGIICKIRSRAFLWSPFDLIERIKIKYLCILHKQLFFLKQF